MAEKKKVAAKQRGPKQHVEPENRPVSGERDAVGRFRPGVTGNAGGRPRSNQQLRAALREYTEQAMAILVELMGDKDPKIRMAAAIEILDRGHGRPTTSVAVEQEETEAESSLPVAMEELTNDQLTRIILITKEPRPTTS